MENTKSVISLELCMIFFCNFLILYTKIKC
jgi:hypothetical protein